MSNSQSTENREGSNSFASRLSELMEKRGLTQKHLGAAIDVSQATVFKWLNGSLPRSGELHRLAKYLGVSMEWFLEGTQQNQASEEEMDTVPLLQLQADRLVAFLREVGWTMEQFEGALDAVEKIQSAADVARLFQMKLKSSVEKLAMSQQSSPMPRTLKVLLEAVSAASSGHGKQKEIADLIGVSTSQLSRWINGEGKPNAEATLKLLSWVEGADEQKQKALAVRSTPPEPKTPKGNSDEEDNSSRPGKESPGKSAKAIPRPRKKQ